MRMFASHVREGDLILHQGLLRLVTAVDRGVIDDGTTLVFHLKDWQTPKDHHVFEKCVNVPQVQYVWVADRNCEQLDAV